MGLNYTINHQRTKYLVVHAFEQERIFGVRETISIEASLSANGTII